LFISLTFFFRNPNEPQEASFRISKERNRFKGIIWEVYDKTQKKYLEIGKICPVPICKIIRNLETVKASFKGIVDPMKHEAVNQIK